MAGWGEESSEAHLALNLFSSPHTQLGKIPSAIFRLRHTAESR